MDLQAIATLKGYVDGLGNKFEHEVEEIELECDNGSLEHCFSYRDYKKSEDVISLDTGNTEVETEHDMNLSSTVDSDVKGSDIDIAKRGPYKNYSDALKQQFWHLLIEEGNSIYHAAKLCCIPLQTAYTWKRNWNKKVINELNGIYEEPKKRGRKPLLSDEHKEFIKTLISGDPTVTLKYIVESLHNKFKDVKAKTTTVNNFITRVCKFSFKRISKWDTRRDMVGLKQERSDWANEYKDKLDFSKNCIFIDEAGFNISMRREYGWSSVGEQAVVKVPVTKGVNISFLGAICNQGCIDLKVRTPKTATEKKRKLSSNSIAVKQGSRATAGNDFYLFVKVDTYSLTFSKLLMNAVQDFRFNEIIGLLVILIEHNNVSFVTTTKIGLNILTTILSRAELIRGEDGISATDLSEWSSMVFRL